MIGHRSALGICFCLLVLLLLPRFASAHEVRPAYLELRQTEATTYDAKWKVPGRGDLRLGVYVELPSGCTNLSEPRATMVNNAFREQWTVQCDGLTGGTIHIAGLSATMIDVLVRIERLDGTTQIARLTPTSTSFVVPASPDALAVARTYLVLGGEHILSGIDHLLFVLALLLVVGRRWRLLFKTITAFTVAHSITLGLATLGFVHVPAAPVEAVIALSIMFVAAEILHTRAGRPGITAHAPWLVAFTFGLLHGFGFAGALTEVGLPQGDIPLALLLFNVGVELGQLLFVAVAVGCMAALRRLRPTWPRWTEVITPYAIGSLAMFWVIQRLAAF